MRLGPDPELPQPVGETVCPFVQLPVGEPDSFADDSLRIRRGRRVGLEPLVQTRDRELGTGSAPGLE